MFRRGKKKQDKKKREKSIPLNNRSGDFDQGKPSTRMDSRLAARLVSSLRQGSVAKQRSNNSYFYENIVDCVFIPTPL